MRVLPLLFILTACGGSTPPPSAGVVSGGGVAASEHYRVSVTVGSPSGQGRSDTHKARVAPGNAR